jgi:outer membrane receptor for Fe3+-dicitrate
MNERAILKQNGKRPAAGLAVLWGSVLLLAVPAAGNETTDLDSSAGPVQAEPLIVTAGRLPQDPAHTPLSVVYFDRADLAASAALTADDFLRGVPGFSLFRRTGSLAAHPTTQGVSLRGIAPSGTSRSLVLYDGMPINDPFGG